MLIEKEEEIETLRKFLQRYLLAKTEKKRMLGN